MATKSIKIGDKEFKVEDVTTKKEKLDSKIRDIEQTINDVREHSRDIHETCKTNSSIDATLKSTIESLKKEQDSSNKLLNEWIKYGEDSAARADVFEKKSTDAEAKANACENEKKLTKTNSFNLVFKASEKTMNDAKKAIENKKKLIIDESPLDDNIKEIYPLNRKMMK